MTIKVAVEGQRDSEQTFQCSIEAPAANWQVEGRADSNGNIALEIKNVPSELQGAQWRITETTWSGGLDGYIATPLIDPVLNYGNNSLRLAVEMTALTEAPTLQVLIQGPDNTIQSIAINLSKLCVCQLKE